MNVVVLGRTKANPSTANLVNALTERQVTCAWLDPLQTSVAVGDPRLRSEGRRLPPPDAVVARIDQGATDHASVLLEHLESQGVPTFPSAASLRLSRHKGRTLMALSAAGIDVPESICLRSTEVDQVIDDITGLPIILKTARGKGGEGVFLAESRGTARAIAAWVERDGGQLIAQRFVEESRGVDVRVFVVGERALGAVRRCAQSPGEYRSNINVGGAATRFPLNDTVASLAVRSAQALGLPFAGVDILMSHRGPLVIEVNSAPGINGFSRDSGIDAAGALADFITAHLAGARVA